MSTSTYPKYKVDDKLIVYTSIVGSHDRDRLRNDQNFSTGTFIAFVDRQWPEGNWLQRPAFQAFRSPRRNSRAPKILAHEFIDCRYSIWMDGRIGLKSSAGALVSEWLDGVDLAVFAHPKRQCTYDEALECSTRELDNPQLIYEQIQKYRLSGLPEKSGLPENSVILRRHSHAMETFNNAWWAEYCRFSVRDQLSFMYAAAQTNLKIRWLSPQIRSTNFDIPNRLAEKEPQFGNT